jgi:hypothetical protein
MRKFFCKRKKFWSRANRPGKFKKQNARTEPDEKFIRRISIEEKIRDEKEKRKNRPGNFPRNFIGNGKKIDFKFSAENSQRKIKKRMARNENRTNVAEVKKRNDSHGGKRIFFDAIF